MTLSSTLLSYQAAVIRSAQTDTDGQFVYRLTDEGYECVTVEHDGYDWAPTGRGVTAARAQDDLIMNVLPDWYA